MFNIFKEVKLLREELNELRNECRREFNSNAYKFTMDTYNKREQKLYEKAKKKVLSETPKLTIDNTWYATNIVEYHNFYIKEIGQMLRPTQYYAKYNNFEFSPENAKKLFDLYKLCQE